MKEQFLNLSGLTDLVTYMKLCIAQHKVIIPRASFSLFPKTGDENNIYIDTSTNAIYRWNDTDKKFVLLAKPPRTIAISEGTNNGEITLKVDNIASNAKVHGLTSTAFTESNKFATAAQGAKADSAVQTITLSSGTKNGTIKIKVNNITTDNIEVAGLGSAAFSDIGIFAAKSHTHKKDEVGLGNVDNTADINKSVKYATSAGAVSWKNITDKPTLFPSQQHNHDSLYYRKNEVDSLLSGKSDTGHTHVQFIQEVKFSNGTYSDPLNGTAVAIKASGGIASDLIYEGGKTLADKYQAKGSYAASSHKQAYTSDECTSYESDSNTMGVTPAAVKKAFGIFGPKAHTHKKTDITDFPTSLPASDVYGWAKASSKPSYTKSEVGLGNVDNTADANKSVKYAGSSGSSNTIVYTALTNTNLNTLQTEGRWYYAGGGNTCTNIPVESAAFELYVGRNASGWRYQQFTVTSGEIYIRVFDSSNWGNWRKLAFTSDTVTAASSVPWSGVTGKPSTYTPSSHTHTVSQISDFSTHVYDATISRTANTVLAAPNGKAGSASFRALVAADIPSITKSKITDFPSSLPASDVYAWAKASSKPSYSWGEITGKPSTFTPSSHTHDYITSSYRLTAGTTANRASGIRQYEIYNNGYPFTYGNVLQLTGSNGVSQIAMQWHGTGLAYRSAPDTSTTFSGWATILTSSNYSSYTVTKTGGGASGTWGINVTGSAGSVAWGNVSGRPSSLPASDVPAWAKASTKPSYSWSEIGSKPSTFTPSSHNHSYLTLYGGRPANINFSTSTNGTGAMFHFVATSSTKTGKPPEDSNVLQMNWDNNGGWDTQFAISNGSSPHSYIRSQNNGTWRNWTTLLDSSNYNNYSPSKTGSGASGTWGINITGASGSCTGNAATASNASKVNGHTVNSDVPSGAKFTDTNTTYPISYRTIDNNFASKYRTQTKGNTSAGDYISTLRCDTNLVPYAPQYGSGLGWGRGDTHGYLYMNYNSPQVYVGAGNADKLNWAKQLAFADHTHSYTEITNRPTLIKAVSKNGYWGMADHDGSDSNWIRTTTAGIIPYQSGGAGAGHCGIGTSSWYFSSAYIDTVNCVNASVSGHIDVGGYIQSSNLINTYFEYQSNRGSVDWRFGAATGTGDENFFGFYDAKTGKIPLALDGNFGNIYVGFNVGGKTAVGVYLGGQVAGNRAFIYNGDSYAGSIWIQTRLDGSWKWFSLGRACSTALSDIRLKGNIRDTEVEDATKVIESMKIRSFERKDSHKKYKIGFIADELEQLDPNLIDGGGEVDGHPDYKSVNNLQMLAYVVKGMQELNSKVTILEKENKRLKQKLNMCN